ncbi:MAG: glutamyl-tRNA reductase [Terriglobia bacterium]
MGVSHKTAPVNIRERLHFTEPRLEEALRQLRAQFGFEESLILSTCNRVELVAETPIPDEALQQLKKFICDFHQVPADPFERFIYGFTNAEAIHHIFRVACSLDSMVLGEPQILGQVKNAFMMAQNAGSVGKTLGSLMNRAFYVAKRVRTETGIAGSAVSVSYAAVELAKKIFNELKGKTVLILGAGKMSELAAKHLTHSGVSRVLVWNRSYPRALELAKVFQGEAILPEELFKHIQLADIIISSTGAPHFILGREDGERIIQLRKNHPVFIIDIAVPRDIDPEINRVNNIFLYDIDDLRNVVDANLRQRQREALSAEDIVRQEVESYLRHSQIRDVTPTIVRLREHWEQIRAEELAKNRKRFGELSPEQEIALENLTQGLLNKILHGPITELKRASNQPGDGTSLDVIKRMFGLKE